MEKLNFLSLSLSLSVCAAPSSFLHLSAAAVAVWLITTLIWHRYLAVVDNGALGLEASAPHEVRAQFSGLFQDAAGCMRLFMWHKDQKSVCHCLIALLQKAQT